MTETSIPQDILVITGSPRQDDSGLQMRDRPWQSPTEKVVNTVTVHMTNLQGQVNVFLQQMNEVLREAPENVGKFRLEAFEVSVGIVVEGKGKVSLALLANVEVGAKVDAGMKFTFKRA